MSVTNGQKANQTTFNNAFMSRTVDTSTTGKVALNNATTATIADAQKAINQVMDATGADLVNSGTDYSAPNDTIDDGDTHEEALGKLADKFDPTTGHAHSGADGDGTPISAGDLADVPLAAYLVESPAKLAVTGTSLDVSADLSGYTESTSSTAEGIVTNAPHNRALIRKSGGTDDGKPLFASGREVYGRVTKAGAVWTLSFYTNIAGVETAYNILSATDFKYYPLQLESPMETPLVYPNLAKLMLDAGGGGSGGAGGGSSFEWIESGGNSAVPDLENNMRVFLFSPTLGQELYAAIHVPSGYTIGNPIKLKTKWYSPDDAGTVHFKSLATLIRTATDQVTSTTNQRTSTNGAVTMTGAKTDEPQAVDLDLTSSTGQINGVDVNPGDTIFVKLYRDAADTSDLDAKLIAHAREVTFT